MGGRATFNNSPFIPEVSDYAKLQQIFNFRSTLMEQRRAEIEPWAFLEGLKH